jgi:hypothetical protein
MATYNKFQAFAEDVFEGVHNFASDTFRIYLTNATPSASADSVKTDLAEISTGGGYTGPITVTVSASSQTGGTYTATINDLTPAFTATGTVAQWRYVVLFNDSTTAKTDPLVGWWDFGSAVDMVNGDEFNVDFADPIISFS